MCAQLKTEAIPRAERAIRHVTYNAPRARPVPVPAAASSPRLPEEAAGPTPTLSAALTP